MIRPGKELFTLLFAAATLYRPSVAAATPPATVEITRFAFEPKEITIAPGTIITWTNHDDTPHTVSSTAKVFDSKAMDTDERYAHTFDQAGDYTYFCAVHPFMTGIVHVRSP